MTSTEIKLGLTCSARPSSRVLKPPGGGHSNIFAASEMSLNAPRPNYNQQNSSNLIACIGSIDPNEVVEKLRDEIIQTKQLDEIKLAEQSKNEANKAKNINDNTELPAPRGRVPPGGHSSGSFW